VIASKAVARLKPSRYGELQIAVDSVFRLKACTTVCTIG
jgi:hypothetical protein